MEGSTVRKNSVEKKVVIAEEVAEAAEMALETAAS